MPSAANIAYYAKLIREKSLARAIISAATAIIEKGYDHETDIDAYIDEAEKMIFEVSENKIKKTYLPISDFIHDSIKLIERLYKKKQAVTGVPTGFTDLDRLTSGLQPSALIIVAGRPSMGKTAFSMNIAQHVSTMQESPVGIGPVYKAKLKEVGIEYVASLLELGASHKGREELAEHTSIAAALIRKWVNMADLMRISGVGEEYSELLEAAGVDTVKELRNRNPENLLKAMLDANQQHAMVRRTPHLSEVESWVEQAKLLDPVITY